MNRDVCQHSEFPLFRFSLMWLFVQRVFFHVVEPAIFPYGILSSCDSFNSYPRNSLSFWAHIHFLSHCYLWNQNGTECDAEQFSPWQMVSGSCANSVHNSQQRLSLFNLSCTGYCPGFQPWDQTNSNECRDSTGRQLQLTWWTVLADEGPEDRWLPPVAVCLDISYPQALWWPGLFCQDMQRKLRYTGGLLVTEEVVALFAGIIS